MKNLLLISWLFIFVNATFLQAQAQEKDVIITVDKVPEPQGGMKAFYQFISRELQYPKLARRIGIEGRVIVQMVVEKDGSISNLQLLTSIGGGCDEEALRAVAASPKWIPGEHKGNKVAVRMAVPIMFKLDGENQNPLLVVNDQVIGRLEDSRDYLAQLKADDIIAVSRLNQKETKKRYQEKAKDGAVIILVAR